MTIREILDDIKSKRKKKVILDTDAYNEIDDQYAIAYSYYCDRLDILCACAEPFHHDHKESMELGMEKSYDEIKRVLSLCDPDHNIPVFKGSRTTVSEAGGMVESDAADAIIKYVRESDEIVYVLAIGAITNVISAVMKAPDIKENMCVIWLGCNELRLSDCPVEFNLHMDFKGGQELFESQVPLVLCPANFVTGGLTAPIEKFRELKDTTPIGHYLWDITEKRYYMMGAYEGWLRTIWDLGAPTVLDIPETIEFDVVRAPILTSERTFAFDDSRHEIIIVKSYDREAVYDKAWKLIKKEI